MPCVVAEPPIAAESDPVESRARGAAHGRQLDIGERELHVPADEASAPPVEIDCHVAVAGVRHDRGIRQKTADGRQVHIVRGRRNAPVARERHAAGPARGVRLAELALRRDHDPARELVRRARFGLDMERAAGASHARLDILEAPRDAAACVEVQHAAVADEHVDIGRDVEAEFIAAAAVGAPCMR